MTNDQKIANGVVKDLRRLEKEAVRLRKRAHDFATQIMVGQTQLETDVVNFQLKVAVSLGILGEQQKYPFKPADD